MDWQAVSALTVIIGTLGAAATIYLRLFVKQEISSSQEHLRSDLARKIDKLEDKLVTREVFNTQLDSLSQRVARLESRIDSLAR